MEINARIIHRISNNCKDFIADDSLFMVALLVAVGVAAFGLGRQSVTKNAVNAQTLGTPVEVTAKMEASRTNFAAKSVATTSSHRFVASKNSDKYHLVTCPGAKQISEANKIYFNSKEEAEASGYSAASNCKALQ